MSEPNTGLTLPEELVWDGEHASEHATTAIADMQMDILPADVLAHVEACAHCTARVGEAALLSAAVDQVWQVAPKESIRPAVAKKFPVPWRALFGAGFLSVAGMAPALLALPKHLFELTHTAAQTVPVVAHVTMAASAAHGPATVIVPAITSALLLASAIVVVRAKPFRDPSLASDPSSSHSPRSS